MTDQGMIRALGAMSGTSIDGVDAAIVVTDGRGIDSFGPGGYRAYDDAERARLRAALGRSADPGDVAAAAEVVETVHAVLLSEFERPDLIGFHGQTLWHAPDDGLTFQAGDGSVLAEILDCPVVWDFRSTDMQMGGQGAPLAPFFHHACARWTGAQAPIAFLNLGGVGNLTWVDPRIAAPEAPGALLAFDTGPANAPIDDLVAAPDGRSAVIWTAALAARGRVADGLPERFLEHPYFAKMPPKSLDRDGFPDLPGMVADLLGRRCGGDAAAIVAASVMEGVRHCPSPPARLLVTGGGRKNPVLMKMIAAALDCPVDPVEAVGLDGDLLEAQAFAYLAVRVLYGLPTSAPGTTGDRRPGGRRPDQPPPARTRPRASRNPAERLAAHSPFLICRPGSAGARDVEARRRQREPVEGKAGADGAAHERPARPGPRGLPVIPRHDDLRRLTAGEVGAEDVILRRPRLGCGQRQDQGPARVEMPDLGRIDPVPMARLARLQQEVDAGARRAASSRRRPMSGGNARLRDAAKGRGGR